VIDLEAMRAPTDSESGDAQYNSDVWELRSRVEALVAELRPAREVVVLARDHYETTHGPGGASYPLPGLGQALDDYDRAVSS